MEKEKNGKKVIKVVDGVGLALHAEEAVDFVDGNQKKKQNRRIRNDTDGNKTKGKKMRKVFQIRNDATSTSSGIDESLSMKEAAEQGKKTRRKHKKSIKDDSATEPTSNNFTTDKNACTVITRDIESGSHSSSSFDDVLDSWVRRQKSINQEETDSSVERNKETEKSKGTEFSTCSLSEKDSLLPLPAICCLKEDSEMNYNAPGVCLYRDRNEAEKHCKKHGPAESIEICQDHEATCSTLCLNAKRSIENDSQTEPPSSNFTPERNASAVSTHDVKLGLDPSLSFSEILSSSFRWQKRDSSLERNNETEKSEGTEFLTSSLSERDLLLQLPMNSCLKENSQVNYNTLGVCRSRDGSEAEKQCEKHDLAESIQIRQDHEATCSAPSSNAGNICSAAATGKPVSEVNSIATSSLETHDDHAVVANTPESEILFTCEKRKSISSFSRREKIVSDPPAVDSESIPDARSLLLVPNREENPSLVQSVETTPSFCSKHVHLKKFDEADVRIPSLLQLCASRDEIALHNDMDLLSQEGSLTGSSGKKLLVLDINGLLADVVYHVLEGYTPDTIISGKSVFKRPFCDDFLEFCFARFNVGVWSSRTKRNVELILDFLMGNAKHKLLFCWDQSHCTNSNLTTVENRRKPLLVKKLKKLWEKYEPGLPWELGQYNASNTLLLDDSPYKAVCNPPYTAVFPTTYRYTDKGDNSLGPGGELRVYLEGLAMAENVQKYVQENPIGKRPITEKNPSWRFYLEVIRACSSPENSPIRPSFHWQGNRQ